MTDNQRNAVLTFIILVLAAVLAVVLYATTAHAEPLPPMPPAEPPSVTVPLPEVSPGGGFVFMPMIAGEVQP